MPSEIKVIRESLQCFLTDPMKTGRMEIQLNEGGYLYVARGTRSVHRRQIPTLEVIDIEVSKRKRGTCRDAFGVVEQVAGAARRVVFVEGVHSDVLAPALLRWGYRRHPTPGQEPDDPLNFYKFPRRPPTR